MYYYIKIQLKIQHISFQLTHVAKLLRSTAQRCFCKTTSQHFDVTVCSLKGSITSYIHKVHNEFSMCLELANAIKAHAKSTDYKSKCDLSKQDLNTIQVRNK